MDHGEIRLQNETVANFPNYLVSRGWPLPADWQVMQPDEVTVRLDSGEPVPNAGHVLQRRPDGSVEWLYMDLLTSLGPEASQTLHLVHEPNPGTPVAHPVTVDDLGQHLVVANGLVTLELNRSGAIVHRLEQHGLELVGADDLVDLEAVDLHGKVYRASVAKGYELTLERPNRLRVSVIVSGRHTARDGSTLLDFELRFTVTAGRADVAVRHTFIDRQPGHVEHQVKSLRMVWPTRMPAASTKLLRQSHHGIDWWPRAVEIAENVEVVSSSVSDLNSYRESVKEWAGGTLFLRNLESFHEDASEYPFYLSPSGGSKFRAEHMTGGVRMVYPFVGWKSPAGDRTVTFAMRWWQALHPKSVTIDERTLTVHLWPEWAGPLSLVQGVSKSHDFWLTSDPAALDVEAVEQRALQWEIRGLTPLAVSLDPAWPRRCEVLECQHFPSFQPARRPALEERLGKVTPGEPNRFTYPRHPPIGMWHFGDHGTNGSFTNNEDDLRCLVPLLEYLRSGEMRHFDFATEAIAHYLEVDHCRWSEDPRRSGGLVPHTYNHFYGEVYPSHQWVEGLAAWYYITGDTRARDATLAVAENHLYWIAHKLPQVCCDGRESGIPLVNLAAAYRLNPDSRYIEGAHVIIDNFQRKWFEQWGELKYPYPQGAMLMWTKDYGNWSTYHGMYRIWEVTGDDSIRELLIKLLQERCRPERFSVDDTRGMDFFAVWAYIQLTGDEAILETLKAPLDNMLRKGGHPTRRLHILGTLERLNDPRLS